MVWERLQGMPQDLIKKVWYSNIILNLIIKIL